MLAVTHLMAAILGVLAGIVVCAELRAELWSDVWVPASLGILGVCLALLGAWALSA